MSVIFNRIFLRAGKVLTHQSIKNRFLSSQLSETCNAPSTPVHVNPNGYGDEDSALEDVLQPPQKPSTLSVLEEVDIEQLPDVSHITPQLRPSFNFAYFANKSEVIKQLIDLGVNFHTIEKNSKKKLPSFLLQLDFEKDVKPYISFLFEKGVPADKLGQFFTKNPYLLRANMDDLQVRINYLESKKFTQDMISRIITVNPYWLNYSTRSIDRILGDFQKELRLTGDDIRNVVCRSPQIIYVTKDRLNDKVFLFKDIVGFDKTQVSALFLRAPYAWRKPRKDLQERIEMMLFDMKVPHSAIVAQPSGLMCRVTKLRERHLFLTELGKAQYDPTKPGYVSIDDISIGNDSTFCDKVAKTTIQTYNLFLKSL